MSTMVHFPAAAVLGVIIMQRRVLLVRRSNPPDAGYWGFPGGKIEPGETIEYAVEREVKEETGLTVVSLKREFPLEAFDYDESGYIRYHYLLLPVICRFVSGEPTAATDVSAVKWFSETDLRDGKYFFSEDVVKLALKCLA